MNVSLEREEGRLEPYGSNISEGKVSECRFKKRRGDG
jgi:hypothetical protein